MVRRSDIEYEEVPKKKKEPEIIDRVIAYLTGHESGALTRLGRRYKKIQHALKMLSEEQQRMNEELTDIALELFDTKDEIYTRVVETMSLTLTLSKKDQDKEVIKFDQQGYIEKLESIVKELDQDIDVIKAAFSKLETVPANPNKKPGLRVTTKEAVNENFNSIISKAKRYVSSVVNKIRGNLDSVDTQIAQLKNDLGRNNR